MKYVLDTSAYSDFNRGEKQLKQFFKSNIEIIVPTIVIGELRAGFAAGNKRSDNEKLLRRFLDTPNVSIITPSLATTKIFADIYLSLRKAGTPIGTQDIWIASICLENGLDLLTTDSDFARVTGLKLIKI